MVGQVGETEALEGLGRRAADFRVVYETLKLRRSYRKIHRRILPRPTKTLSCGRLGEGQSMHAYEWSSLFVNTVSAITAIYLCFLGWNQTRRSASKELAKAKDHVLPLQRADEDYVKLILNLVNRFFDRRNSTSLVVLIPIMLLLPVAAILLGVYSTKIGIWATLAAGPSIVVVTIIIVFMVPKMQKTTWASFFHDELEPALRDPRLNAHVASVIVRRFVRNNSRYGRAVTVSVAIFNELDRRQKQMNLSSAVPVPESSVQR